MEITRSVETELASDELWELVADAAAWASWMVDRADVDVEPGATGVVLDDGVERTVRIDGVDNGRRIEFTWWPVDQPDAASAVELVVVRRPAGSILHITETYPLRASASVASAALAWDVRAVLLAAMCLSLAAVM